MHFLYWFKAGSEVPLPPFSCPGRADQGIRFDGVEQFVVVKGCVSRSVEILAGWSAKQAAEVNDLRMRYGEKGEAVDASSFRF